MAKCCQCGNGFGFRGEKFDRSDIEKHIQEINDSAHDIIKKQDTKQRLVGSKELLELRKQYQDNPLWKKIGNGGSLICRKCFYENLHDEHAVEIQFINQETLTSEQLDEFNSEFHSFHDKFMKQSTLWINQAKLNKAKAENSNGTESLFTCIWCKNNFKELDIQSIEYGYGSYSTNGVECNKCKDIRKGLYSDKLDSLLTERSNKKSKDKELDELIREANRAKSEASSRVNFDDWAGDRTDKITTQNRYDDLVMQSNDIVRALSDIEWNISTEKERLAEEHFFKNISNNAEDKDNPKAETPLEILKVRLAKGEITLEEFKNIKENLDE